MDHQECEWKKGSEADGYSREEGEAQSSPAGTCSHYAAHRRTEECRTRALTPEHARNAFRASRPTYLGNGRGLNRNEPKCDGLALRPGVLKRGCTADHLRWDSAPPYSLSSTTTS